MAVGNDPTDEELQQVILEVREVVRKRKEATRQWIREQLAQAVKEATANRPT